MKIYAQKPIQPQHESTLHPSRITQHTTKTQADRSLLQANAEGSKVLRVTAAPTSFAHDFSRIPVHAKVPAKPQSKLKINTPGDTCEQEADSVSERVMRMPEPQPERACGCGGGCPECRNVPDAHEHLETKHVQATAAGEIAAPPVAHKILRSPGQPLDSAARKFFEPRFGQDFSRVRVHSGPAAERMAESLRARAFTLGSDIVFGRGEYAPATDEGRSLLAHELAHTRQQSSNTIYRKIKVGGTETPAAGLLVGVTAEVNTWYTGIVTTLTTQMGASFNAATDMPFTQTEAVQRAAQILREMEDAEFEKPVESKTFSYDTSRAPYDFNFGSAQDVSNEVLFRLSLMLHMSLANRGKTAYARYRSEGETGLNLQDSATWQPTTVNTQFTPGGFQLQPGTTPSAAIKQLTAPVANVQQRIVVDCSTMIGILHYKALEERDPAQFDAKFQNNMIVGPLEGLYGDQPQRSGDKPQFRHPLTASVYRKKSPYMRPLKVSQLEDLVPGDTVRFVNYAAYRKLAPGGLWTGEWGIYTRKEGTTLYFEGFGVTEQTYEDVIETMRSEYKQAWDSADPNKRPEFKNEEPAGDTIEGKHPGINQTIFRIDLAEYNKP